MTNERERIRRELVTDPRVVEAVVDAVHERVPAYADLDDGRRGEVRAIAGWALERFLHLWAVDGDIGPADLRRFRGIAAARAADGRPLPAVLRAYRVAAAVLVDEIAARAAPSAAADAFALTRQLLTTLDTLCEVMAGSYTATSERLAGDRAQALRLLLDDLIAGRHASVGAVTDRAARLGVELPYPYCLLVVGPGEGDRPADPAELLAVLTGPATGTPLATAQGPRTVLLLPADAVAAAPGVLAERGLRGCAITGEGLDRIAVAHRLAAGALATAPEHAHRPGRLLTDADAHVLALLAGHPATDAEHIGRLVLGLLARSAQRHLLEALTAYLDTGSATAAARGLRLHPQSLRYRLRRVRELTGRDPRDPWQRLTLDIARTVAGPPPG
ncbi:MULTISPECIES: PucR family transcriptional regulator [Streptomyces]|uniref:PucR family transcriptional regulator n=1 Tax=Streptomyces TaxID=1883 RepID=UPI00163C468D|nr:MULTISPECIES: PucR family transcriptional regulator [Streptomyces]MBC2878727.1 helix-turn-helix domain-containing protein [Streptomyces sp. TYQ1024]UBI35170.1 helix-turn-helix domain-containing protein [Streptomyces mobaraensis]UKW27762.1 helix-turn-helix domain-containing protein [Streptomyces sp. TYQ1024]